MSHDRGSLVFFWSGIAGIAAIYVRSSTHVTIFHLIKFNDASAKLATVMEKLGDGSGSGQSLYEDRVKRVRATGEDDKKNRVCLNIGRCPARTTHKTREKLGHRAAHSVPFR